MADEPKIEKPNEDQIFRYGGGTITGGINLPPPDRKPMTDQEKVQAGQITDFRFLMTQAIKLIGGLCGSFEQTTHGMHFSRESLTFDKFQDLTFDKFQELFKIAWDFPTAYNISNLSQFVNQFQKVKGW